MNLYMENSNNFKTNPSSFKITNSEKKTFFITFSKIEDKLEISINEQSIFSASYKVSLELKYFQELNKFFRQFDNVSELLEFLLSFEHPEEKLDLISDNKFIYLIITLPCISKNKENKIKISIPQVEIKENDLIMKICQQVNKIDMLESKINFILNCLGKSESDFTRYENIKYNFKNGVENSRIINPEDFF